MIKGVLVAPQERIPNRKGDIYHVIKQSEAGFVGFGEAYFSTIIKNEIKGWKKHSEMTLNIIVPVGEIRFVMFDERPGSSTRGMFQEVVLSSTNYCRLTIPPKVWLGFQGKGDGLNLLLNIANIEHLPEEVAQKHLEEITYSWV